MGELNELSTADEVLGGIDLTSRRVLVTGVSAGLGVETARVLAARGAFVVGAARDLEKAAQETKPVVEQAANGGRLELVELDLASLKSVRACADALNAAGQPFDVVIANAGVMACPFGKTEDGFEMQFGTNHLGHFVLVNRIASLIKVGGRFISLSSVAHRMSDIDLDDPNFEHQPYDALAAYGRSKTANVLFPVEFSRRHAARGVSAAAVHPGAILETQLQRHITPEYRAQSTSKSSVQLVRKTIPQGAATSVWAGFIAPAPDIDGRYCDDCHVASVNDDPAIFSGVRSYALDRSSAQALWSKSEEMVGEKY